MPSPRPSAVCITRSRRQYSETVDRAPGSPQLLPGRTRDLAHACNAELLDPLPRQACRAALAWLDSGWAERPASVAGQPVFAQGDPNLANHLWNGHGVHLVDFETSGRGDRATELADFVEHITVWAHAGINAEAFLDRFDLRPGERQQITQLRQLFAAFWVMRLLPSGSAYHRNPRALLNARRAACSTYSGAPDDEPAGGGRAAGGAQGLLVSRS
jgi:hypothetical protein